MGRDPDELGAVVVLLPLWLNLEDVSAGAAGILQKRRFRRLARIFGFGVWYHYDR